MKRIIFLIVAIVLVVAIIIVYNIQNYQNMVKQTKEINKAYESFYNKKVLGTDVASLINKIEDSNTSKNIAKDDKGQYIENEDNSIKLEIKFSENDNVISLEAIEKQGIDKFVQYFGAMEFECTKIEYHDRTKLVKYIYFEQV